MSLSWQRNWRQTRGLPLMPPSLNDMFKWSKHIYFFLGRLNGSILLSKVIVSASSEAVALAFDVGCPLYQNDIWIGDLTEQEGKQFLKLRGHENKWKDIVDA